jgi:hypothetical protein
MLVTNPLILKSDASYTFHDYFKMKFAAKDILADLGCQLIRGTMDLPRSPWDVKPLQEDMVRYIPMISLDSEDARKQALISPLLLKLVLLLNIPMEIQYPIAVNQWLKGSLDYFLSNNEHNMIVIEAKNADMSRGFVQMAVELIALQLWLSRDREFDRPLFGAVTTGDAWQFGQYHPGDRTILQDVNLYTVPHQLTDVAAILKGILSSREELPTC